jgi:hypothetical protein
MSFSGHKSFIKMMLISIISVVMSAQLSGCASDSYASKGAKQGAMQGAAAGAVGGLVSALVFGGDPLDRAARGAVYGGTAGAVAGGISGSNRDKQIQAQKQAQAKSKQDADLEALKKEIGRPAYNGLAALAECQHDVTLKKAKKAQKSKNPDYRLAGLWLEVLAYADSRQEEHASKLLPVIVKEEQYIKTQAEAEQAVREALGELTVIRREYNLPLVCAA